jgi:hypothetical protein
VGIAATLVARRRAGYISTGRVRNATLNAVDLAFLQLGDGFLVQVQAIVFVQLDLWLFHVSFVLMMKK